MTKVKQPWQKPVVKIIEAGSAEKEYRDRFGWPGRFEDLIPGKPVANVDSR